MVRRMIYMLVALIIGVCAGGCTKTQKCIDYSKTKGSTSCTTVYDPVCGCDDITYQNECFADKAGVVSWIEGPCLN